MTVKVFSAVIHQGQVHPVTIEVSKSRGSLPGWRFVGSVQESVREGKERVWSALKTLGLDFPRGKYTVNIQPAKIPKTGSSLDLALVLAVLQLHRYIPEENYAAVGELGLSGQVLAPEGNFALVDRLLDGIVYGSEKLGDLRYHPLLPNFRPVKNLSELLQNLQTGSSTKRVPESLPVPVVTAFPLEVSRSLVKVLALALVGGHPTLLFGSPGSGKSYTKKLVELLLPPESLENWVQRQVQKDINPEETSERIATPPHTFPRAALLRLLQKNPEGVFLDELPEFRPECREALRQWLEVTPIVQQVCLPEVTIATANPCLCGYFGTVKCHCRPDERARYQKKLSGPLLDRFSIQWRVTDKDLTRFSSSEWLDWQEKIRLARELQSRRPGFPTRAAQYTWAEVVALQGQGMVQRSPEQTLRRSLFVYQVAQTLADLEQGAVQPVHIFEARQLVSAQFTAEFPQP